MGDKQVRVAAHKGSETKIPAFHKVSLKDISNPHLVAFWGCVVWEIWEYSTSTVAS